MRPRFTSRLNSTIEAISLSWDCSIHLAQKCFTSADKLVMPIIQLSSFGLEHIGNNRLTLCFDQSTGNIACFGLNFGDHVINDLHFVKFRLLRTCHVIPRSAQEFRQFLRVSEYADKVVPHECFQHIGFEAGFMTGTRRQAIAR